MVIGGHRKKRRQRFLNLDMSDFYNQTVDLDLLKPIGYLLRSKGRSRVKDISGYSSLSQRQSGRIFKQEIGISIKRTASLVHYQNVWREVIQEAAVRYGYADQSHLLGEFKRFHGLYPSQAKREALERR